MIVGRTSAGSSQRAAIAALADQAAGRPLGYITPAIYAMGNSPTAYANDFHEIAVGNDQLAGTDSGTAPGPAGILPPVGALPSTRTSSPT